MKFALTSFLWTRKIEISASFEKENKKQRRKKKAQYDCFFKNVPKTDGNMRQVSIKMEVKIQFLNFERLLQLLKERFPFTHLLERVYEKKRRFTKVTQKENNQSTLSNTTTRKKFSLLLRIPR